MVDPSRQTTVVGIADTRLNCADDAFIDFVINLHGGTDRLVAYYLLCDMRASMSTTHEYEAQYCTAVFFYNWESTHQDSVYKLQWYISDSLNKPWFELLALVR